MSSRVLHLAPATYGSLIGTARELAAAQREDGWDTRLVGIGPSPLEANPWGLYEDCLVTRFSGDPLTVWRLHQRLREQPVDRIHAWGSTAARIAALAPAAKQTELMVTLHEESDIRKLGRAPWRAVLPRVDRWYVRNSEWTAALKTIGVAAERISVAPLGVRETARHASPPHSSDWTWGTWTPPDDGRFYVATTGRWSNAKQLKELIWTMCVFENIVDVVLVVIGEGPQWEMLERYSRLILQKDSSRFLGWRPDARQIVSRCAVYWPAGDRHQWDLATLEAMADGVPVIAEDSSLHRTLIEHRDNGLLSLPARGVERARLARQIRENPDWGVELGCAGRDAVLEQFPLAAALQPYLSRARAHCAA